MPFQAQKLCLTVYYCHYNKKGGIFIKWHALFKFPASELGQICILEPAHSAFPELLLTPSHQQHSTVQKVQIAFLFLCPHYRRQAAYTAALRYVGYYSSIIFPFIFLVKSFSQYCNVFNIYFKTIKPKLAKKAFSYFACFIFPRHQLQNE